MPRALRDFAVRAWLALDRPAAYARLRWLAPLLAGLLAVRRGQDDNWDLHNYHHYNPFALLHGKIGFDLAPAQWQSYFNPTIDLVYYGLAHTLPGPLAGFLMGALHGLNLLLVGAIALALLPRTPAPRYRAALLLAGAGALAPAFLTELGNSMGDNLASPFVLGGLWLLAARWERLAADRRTGRILLAAGAAAGVGAGLKLTNATYALALCLALLSLPLPVWGRVRAAFVFGIGTLAGVAASAGHWYWKMWSVFGNPLFPQFNHIFQGPLAGPVAIGDTGWLPKGMAEKLLWPFVVALHPERTVELHLKLFLLPLLYAAFIALAVRLLAGMAARKPLVVPSPTRFLLLFMALAYCGWLNLFGIYRYLVPLELLAPLALWLIAHLLLPAAWARAAAAGALALVTVALFPLPNWGHGYWARESFSAQVPQFAQPRQSMVITVHSDPPLGWLVPLFPAELAFVSLGAGFPESPGYMERLKRMTDERAGPFHVMAPADRHHPHEPRTAEQAARALAENAQVLEKTRATLDRYGFLLDAATCKAYPAFIGGSRYPFQLCTVYPKGRQPGA